MRFENNSGNIRQERRRLVASASESSAASEPRASSSNSCNPDSESLDCMSLLQRFRAPNPSVLARKRDLKLRYIAIIYKRSCFLSFIFARIISCM